MVVRILSMIPLPGCRCPLSILVMHCDSAGQPVAAYMLVLHSSTGHSTITSHIEPHQHCIASHVVPATASWGSFRPDIHRCILCCWCARRGGQDRQAGPRNWCIQIRPACHRHRVVHHEQGTRDMGAVPQCAREGPDEVNFGLWSTMQACSWALFATGQPPKATKSLFVVSSGSLCIWHSQVTYPGSPARRAICMS